MTTYLVAGLTLLAAVISAWATLHFAQQERDALRAELTVARATWAAASQASDERQREIERLRTKAVDHVASNAKADASQDERRIAELRATADRLRAHIKLLAASTRASSSDTTTATGGEAATGPGLVLADLYRGVDDEAIELAAALDASRRAGLTCERIYDATRDTQ